jgi:hypothetical protein
MASREMGRGRRANSECHLTVAKGEVSGRSLQSAALAPQKVSGPVIVDFALGAWLAGQELGAGDTVRVSVVKCAGANGPDVIEVLPYAAVVREATFARAAGAAAEPAWELEPVGSYGFGAIVARNDRAVLRATTPQGSVGHSIDSIRP